MSAGYFEFIEHSGDSFLSTIAGSSRTKKFAMVQMVLAPLRHRLLALSYES